MATLQLLLEYVRDIFFGWFGLAVLLLGANDVLKWLWPTLTASKWLGKHRWQICAVLFIAAQGSAYQDVSDRLKNVQSQLNMRDRRIQVLESADRSSESNKPSNEPNAEVRTEHLKRLHAALMVDSSRFKVVLDRLSKEGRSADLGRTEYKADVESFWRPDVLSADMQNHYADYFREKAFLEKTLAKHDFDSNKVFEGIRASIPKVDLNDGRLHEIALGQFDKCQGREGMNFNVSPGGGWNYWVHGGGSSTNGGAPPDELRTTFDTYKNLLLDKGLLNKCEELFKESTDIARKVTDLDAEAKRLAEVMTLNGTCEFVK